MEQQHKKYGSTQTRSTAVFEPPETMQFGSSFRVLQDVPRKR
jgi:hypothetical protein